MMVNARLMRGDGYYSIGPRWTVVKEELRESGLACNEA